MKNSILYLGIIFALLVGCKKENTTVQEKPDGIIRTQTCSTLYSRIIELFPEETSNVIRYPFLFSDTVRKEILLTKESEVYITFVAESAQYKNTLGWYAYKSDSLPKSSKDFSWQVLFPNVSGVGEGGQLNQGDMLQLGTQKFPAGTVIGFFLIVKGWNNGIINFNNPVDFTNSTFNIDQLQQTVLFKEKNCGDIVLAFEDTPLNSGSDKDFNDLLFTISDNKDGYEAISFDLSKVPSL